MFLAARFLALDRFLAAAIAATLGLLYHPPTVIPFLALYLWLVLQRRDYLALWPLAAGVVLLAIPARLQPGAVEKQVLLARVSSDLENGRAPYSWVSTWSAN